MGGDTPTPTGRGGLDKVDKVGGLDDLDDEGGGGLDDIKLDDLGDEGLDDLKLDDLASPKPEPVPDKAPKAPN